MKRAFFNCRTNILLALGKSWPMTYSWFCINNYSAGYKKIGEHQLLLIEYFLTNALIQNACCQLRVSNSTNLSLMPLEESKTRVYYFIQVYSWRAALSLLLRFLTMLRVNLRIITDVYSTTFSNLYSLQKDIFQINYQTSNPRSSKSIMYNTTFSAEWKKESVRDRYETNSYFTVELASKFKTRVPNHGAIVIKTRRRKITIDINIEAKCSHKLFLV